MSWLDFMSLTSMSRSQSGPGTDANLWLSTHRPVLAYRFERINLFQGECEDPGVDLDVKVTVTQRQRSKQALVDDLRHWSCDRALINSVSDLNRLVLCNVHTLELISDFQIHGLLPESDHNPISLSIKIPARPNNTAIPQGTVEWSAR